LSVYKTKNSSNLF